MLEKTVSPQGKITATLDSLIEWDKNPRYIKDEDFFRLKKQIARLGMYKPLFVNSDGVVVGGNMRLRALRWLNENIFIYNDANGQEVQIDRRGQFNNVWITELGINERDIDGVKKYSAILDGVPESAVFDSIEQMMIEYGISDNDPAGAYDQKALFTLIQPHKMIPLPDYKLHVQPAASFASWQEKFNNNATDGNKKKANKPFGVVIECETPGEQETLLQNLKSQGFNVKPL